MRRALVCAMALAVGCTGGSPPMTECASEAECEAAPCAIARCTEEGRCASEDAPDGTPCASDDACFVDRTCTMGVCGGGSAAPSACGARECGIDACGNTCGLCEGGERCTPEGACVADAVRPLRYFLCQDTTPAEGFALTSVLDGGGDAVLIRTAGACVFDLVYRDSAGSEATLTSEPAGYATVVARAFASGRRAVCASNVEHHLHPRSDPRFPPLHEIDLVRIDCWIYDGSRWSPTGTVVPASADAAAWTSDVEEDASGPGTFALRYARDFSFQLLNLSNAGRPATDGTYRVLFESRAGAAPVASAGATQLSSQVVSDEAVTVGGWEPTAADRARWGSHMSFDEGPCPPPDGCPP